MAVITTQGKCGKQLIRGGKYSGPQDHWSQKIFYAGRKKKGREEKGGKKEKKRRKRKEK